MSHKIDGQILAITPRVWTFKEFFNKEVPNIPQKKWAWVNFSELRICIDNVRKMTGRFPLPSHVHHPALVTAFGHLMSTHVNDSGIMKYTFIEKDGGRLHCDVDYCHDNIDDLFFPMGWAKVVLDLVGKGVNEIRHQTSEGRDTPNLFARFEGTTLKQEIVNKGRSRMGWRLSGPITRL